MAILGRLFHILFHLFRQRRGVRRDGRHTEPIFHGGGGHGDRDRGFVRIPEHLSLDNFHLVDIIRRTDIPVPVRHHLWVVRG